MHDKGYGAVIAETLTGEGGACADAAYFILYKDSFKLIAGKKITLMKENGNLPSADTRILPEVYTCGDWPKMLNHPG